MTENTETAVVVQEEQAVEVPTLIWEVAILEKKEAIKLTPELIKSESKVLTNLIITNIFDTTGYDAVKKAKNKAVKTRTAIQRKETEVLGVIKTRHADELKEVKDYATKLYTACKEVEDDLQGKLTDIDEKKAAEAKRLKDEQDALTVAREAKMFELGMMFNGQAYVGYGKILTKDTLFGMSPERYEAYVVEIAGLQMEQGVTGNVAPAPVGVPKLVSTGFGGGWGGGVYKKDINIVPAPVYEISMPALGVRIFITNGIITAEPDALVANDCINNSNYYLQVTNVK